MRNFWINAEDFGECSAVDSAIKRCFELGTVHTATVIPTLLDYNSINLLRDLQSKGLYVGLHVDLVQGKVFSEEMQRALGQDTFPGKTFWSDFPSELTKTIYAEFKAQYEYLRDNKIDIVNLSYHTIFPFFYHNLAWQTYVDFALDYKLPYRGLNAKSRYAHSFKMIRKENLKLLAKCLKRNPTFIGNLLQGLIGRTDGTFESDISLYNSENKTKEILQKIVHDNKELEIIVHVVDPDLDIPENFDMSNNKATQYKMLMSDSVVNLLKSIK